MSRAPGAELDAGRTIPGWVLHSALAVSAVATFCAAAAGTALPAGAVLVVSLVIALSALATLHRSGYLPLGITLVTTTIALLAFSPAGYTWRIPVLMLTIHATARLSWYVTLLTRTTQVELAVLGAEGRRFAIINLVSQGVALFAGAMTAMTESASPLAWTGVLGAVVLVILAVALRTGARAWPGGTLTD